MAENQEFARLVSLACHDLRTPLATVYGFARTLTRTEGLGEPATRYVGMIEAASQQLGALLDDLGLAARIEGGRYEPARLARDTLEVARAAADRCGDDVTADGAGEEVLLDPDPVERALAAFAVCALRHGAVDRVAIAVEGRLVRIGPVTEAAAPVMLGRDLKDLGSAVGLRLLAALGAEVELAGEALEIRL